MKGFYHIVTFGCQMNKNDSEHIAGMLTLDGYQPCKEPAAANILVFNTCAVRDRAERRVYGQVAHYGAMRKKQQLNMKIFLAGCMPAYKKAELKKELPYLDGFIEIEEARQYPALRQESSTAWISIMYGCNNFCSYCIVPYTRGREKSRSEQDIIEEIGQLELAKYDYLCLLGQNVNSYCGQNGGFPALLARIIKEFPVLRRIGFLTSHPKDMSEELIELISSEPKIDRELHFPIQHMNNRILKLMNRGYTYEQYVELVEKIRARVPNVKISTDLIVGFPSETEEEFRELLTGVQKIGFYRVITAAYSIRSGTKAADLPGMLDEETKNRRLKELNAVVKNKAAINQKNVDNL